MAQASDLKIAVETHQGEEESEKAVSRASRSGQHVFTHAPAQQSANSIDGNYGGCILGTASGVKHIQLSDAQPRGAGFRAASPNLVGTQIEFQTSPALFFGSYHRGGFDKTILQRVVAYTNGGRIPFVLAGDFNQDPESEEVQFWCGLLEATVLLAHGGPTCAASGGAPSTLDYLMVSKELRPLFLSCWVDWAVPFGPHAAIRFQMARCPRKACVAKQIVPMKLPEPLPERPLTEKGWEEARAEANKVISHDFFSRPSAETRRESYRQPPA